LLPGEANGIIKRPHHNAKEIQTATHTLESAKNNDETRTTQKSEQKVCIRLDVRKADDSSNKTKAKTYFFSAKQFIRSSEFSGG